MDSPENNAKLIQQLYSIHKNNTKAVPIGALVEYVSGFNLMVTGLTAFANDHPEVVNARLQERVDTYKTEKGSRNPTPVDITADYIFGMTLVVLQNAAMDLYGSLRIPDFKLFVEVIRGFADSYAFLKTGIDSLRNTIPEFINTYIEVGSEVKGRSLTEDEVREIAARFYANGRLAESQLIADRTGFRTVDYHYRNARMTRRTFPSRSYNHLGSKLFRSMYKAAYPLVAGLIAQK